MENHLFFIKNHLKNHQESVKALIFSPGWKIAQANFHFNNFHFKSRSSISYIKEAEDDV
jgi:hypothetical protein